MKKLFTILLGLSLALGVASTAFADDAKPTTKSSRTKKGKHKKRNRSRSKSKKTTKTAANH